VSGRGEKNFLASLRIGSSSFSFGLEQAIKGFDLYFLY